jgi:plasmid stabilization system protein ParE
MPLIVRLAAAADIDEAFLWYEQQRAGLGAEFLNAVQSALDDLASHPAQYQIIHRNTRRMVLRRFPYSVFYRIYDEVIVIVACMHVRRNPRRWRART